MSNIGHNLIQGGGIIDRSHSGPNTSTSLYGTQLSNPASINTKGAYTVLEASTAMPYSGFFLVLRSRFRWNCLVDVAVGGSGNEVNIIDNFLQPQSIGGSQLTYVRFDIPIPEGSRITARYQCNVANNMPYAGIIGFMLDGYDQSSNGKILTLGAVTSDSSGTEVDSGTTSMAYGAWTQLEASTAQDIVAIMPRVSVRSGETTFTTSSTMYQVGVGAASSEIEVTSFLTTYQHDTTDQAFPWVNQWLPCWIPKGSRVSIRTISSITSSPSRLRDCTIMGLMP